MKKSRFVQALIYDGKMIANTWKELSTLNIIYYRGVLWKLSQSSPQEMLQHKLTFTGTQVNYFFVCLRKLWFFSHDLEMEHGSDMVLLGKLLHETSYRRKFKEVMIESIKIDFLERGGCEIHEVKRSRRVEKAHLYQLLYYLYYLKRLGVEAKGVLNYPLLKKTVDAELTPEREVELEGIFGRIREILALDKPPVGERKGYCKKCSYSELCWS